ncbi:hypothetical protein BG006_000336 [Podila minutissima]|uniref:Peptide hydrolase n=1 Tax=Podila minutissima TaxID=64525 RepID=A0A9P5SSV3_9FUNG|nr:hypothetical protein BG006_000336 [Podila minutissima]
MSERKKYLPLPTTESKSGSPGPVDPPSYSATSDPTVYMSTLAQQEVATRRRRRLRIGFFKLCLVSMIVYALLWPTSDPEHGEKRTGGRPHHVNRRPKNMPPFSFEKHMQGDVEQIIAGSLESNIVWDRLAEMTDTFGHRLVGSDALEKSIDWILAKAKADNLSVTTESVTVDYWQRNHESLYFLSPTRGAVKLHMLGLGYSVSTRDPVNGLEAEIIVAHSKGDLDALAAQGLVRGRIVLWNKKFESYNIDSIFRVQGAVWAQEHGAVASLARSAASLSLQSPHTGAAKPAKIPMASVSAEDADLLERALRRHQQDPQAFPDWPKVKLTMSATTELDARVSRNIIFELKGRERPGEVVVVGGHIDSWDVGVGALDDGAGCFIAWETIRQLSRLERPPRRTVRVVFWTSEENTGVGGRVYAKNHPETTDERHVFAFESDMGVFDAYGIAYTPGLRDDDSMALSSTQYLEAAGDFFLGSRKDLGYPGAGKHVLPRGFGEDIEPICNRGVACVEFISADPFPLPYSTSPWAVPEPPEAPKKGGKKKHDRRRKKHHKHHHDKNNKQQARRPLDSGYFNYHHTEADSMSVFTPEQLKTSAAVMAVWTYIAAESEIDF